MKKLILVKKLYLVISEKMEEFLYLGKFFSEVFIHNYRVVLFLS